MLEGDAGKDSWWSSWVQSAKEKSENVFNFVKHDLSEFTATMQNDVAYVKEKLTQENASAASKKVKQGVTNVLGALIIRPPDDDDSEMITIVDGQPVVFDRNKARLHALQIDPLTYISDPEGFLKDKYDHFIDHDFDLENLKGDISDLLVTNGHVRSIYTQLVPITISNVDFWRRYFFKRQQLYDEEMRRSQIIRRVDEVPKEELGWDEEFDDQSPNFAKKNSDKVPVNANSQSKLSYEPGKDNRTMSEDKNNLDSSSGESNHPSNDINPPAADDNTHRQGNEIFLEAVSASFDSSDSVTVKDVIGMIPSKEPKNLIDNANTEISLDEDINLSMGNQKFVSEDNVENKVKPVVAVGQKDDSKLITGDAVITEIKNLPLVEAYSNLDQGIKLSMDDRKLVSEENKIEAGTVGDNYDSKLVTGDAVIKENKKLPLSEANDRSSSSNSPTSWSNISTGMNSKETNSVQSSPIESDANDKMDTLTDDWEKDFDVTITEDDRVGVKSTVSMQIISNPNPSSEDKSDDWEDW